MQLGSLPWRIAGAAAALALAGAAWAAVASASGEGATQAQACQAAKDDAARTIQQVHGVERVDRYEPCVCSQAGGAWTCTVNAHFTPAH